MTQEEMRNLFAEDYERLLLLLEESFKKVFMTDLKVEYTFNEATEATSYVDPAELPLVVLSLEVTTDQVFKHLFFSKPELFQELYRRFVNAEEPEELQEEHLAGLQEVLDQIMEEFKADYQGAGLPFAVTARKLELVTTPEELTPYLEGEGLAVDFQVTIGENQFPVKHFLQVAEVQEETEGGEGETPESAETAEEGAMAAESAATPETESEPQAETPPATEPSLPDESEMETVGVHPAEFDSLGESQPEEQSRNLDILMDVELEVVAELGRKTMTIKEILKLGKRSIIELDKAAGEPLEIFVNGHKFAEGEVVVVDDQFGIRLINLVSPEERIKNLA